MKKITLATIKSFIRRNSGALYIRNRSDFDGMTDMVEHNNNQQFKKADAGEFGHDLGIKGAWFVLSGRDSFATFDDDTFTGFNIYNCCGEFDIVIPKD